LPLQLLQKPSQAPSPIALNYAPKVTSVSQEPSILLDVVLVGILLQEALRAPPSVLIAQLAATVEQGTTLPTPAQKAIGVQKVQTSPGLAELVLSTTTVRRRPVVPVMTALQVHTAALRVWQTTGTTCVKLVTTASPTAPAIRAHVQLELI
jgi:hypothetical protein